MSKDNRDEIRMDVQLDTIGTFFIKGVNKTKKFKVMVKIMDISSSGLRCVTDSDIPEYVIFSLKLNLNNVLIDIKTNIIWKNQSEDEYSYGCKLIESNSTEQHRIREYIYNEQLKIRKMIYKEALPYGEFMPLCDDIDPEMDKLFEKKYVVLKDECDNEYSKHLVETYLIKLGKFKGRLYHIFTLISGKSVIDYQPYDYRILSEYIDITFRFSIFQINEDAICPVPINPDYRLFRR